MVPINHTPNIHSGCFHLESFYNHGEGRKAWRTLEAHYTKILRCLREQNPIIYQHCYNNAAQTEQISTIRPTWLCMQCTSIFSEKAREEHFEDKSHSFFVCSRGGYVHCMSCEDMVFDPQLEKIRESGGKRRKFDNQITHEEYKVIAANSNHVPCRAIGLRGFYNMGNTCFMSAVLQCLIHNPLIRAHFLANGHNKEHCEIEYCVSCAMDEIFTEFYTHEKTEGYGAVIMLMNTWKTAESSNAGLAGYEQQDAHEYMQFMLNSIHMTNGGTSDSHGECDCIIHETFYGKLQSCMTCDHCKSTTSSIEPFLDLSLDIPQNSKKIKDGQSLRLEDCLQRFIRGENLSYACHKCTTTRTGTKQYTILRLPHVICIHLKRFSHSKDKSSKLSTPVKFPLVLNMMPYTTLYEDPKSWMKYVNENKKTNGHTNGHTEAPKKANDNSPDTPDTPSKTTTKPPTYEELLQIPKEQWPIDTLGYSLSAVIVHKGEINSGHYINYAREGTDWFLFDDSKVVLVNESEVLQSEAYLLLYVLNDSTPWIVQS